MPDFEERQAFRQWWFVALVVLVAVGSWAPLVGMLTGAGGSGPDPLWIGVLVALLGGIAFPLWLLLLELRVAVDGAGVHIRFRGLRVDRTVAFIEMTGVAAVTYRPIREYGGWGIRWRGKGRVAYTVSGDRGARIDLVNGSELLLGSHQAGTLARTIASRARVPVADDPGGADPE